MATIGFIGLGNMGAPMAANLLRAGHAVRGYDLSPTAAATATDLGIDLAGSAREAVAGADIVVTMLPAGKHVAACYADILPAAAPGTLFIDCSTIDVAARAGRARGGGGRRHGQRGRAGVRRGRRCAGRHADLHGRRRRSAFARAEPILAAMGKRIVRCGEAGAGQAAKVCNNMILGISMIAVSEAFVLAEKLGLSHQALFDVASTASGQCWSLTTYCPVPGPVPAIAGQPGLCAGLRHGADAEGPDAGAGRGAAAGAQHAAGRAGRGHLRALRRAPCRAGFLRHRPGGAGGGAANRDGVGAQQRSTPSPSRTRPGSSTLAVTPPCPRTAL